MNHAAEQACKSKLAPHATPTVQKNYKFTEELAISGEWNHSHSTLWMWATSGAVLGGSPYQSTPHTNFLFASLRRGGNAAAALLATTCHAKWSIITKSSCHENSKETTIALTFASYEGTCQSISSTVCLLQADKLNQEMGRPWSISSLTRVNMIECNKYFDDKAC